MNRRKRTSGGQAIVMVSLALFSMAGMMGLAVDLGWSYFTQKEAQASADGAAMAAVHEAWARLNGSVASGVTCANTANNLYCSPSLPPIACGTGNASGTSNLYNGCLYAINNGFNYATNSKIQVTMQSDVGSLSGVLIGSLPTTPTGASLNIKDIAYWVTVRTVKSTPQLFSAMLGNNNGIVSAIGTAAIVAVTTPGSFYGMNQVGDCLTVSGVQDNCGVDINIKGNGSVCANSGGVSAVLCAPNGILLASECNGNSLPTGATAGGCGAGNQNFAGMTDKTQTKAWAATYQHIAGAGAVNNVGSFIPTPSNGANDTGDVFEGKVQPPVLAPSSQGACVLTSSGIQGTSGNQPPLLLAPYNYYVKTTKNGVSTYGDPIQISGNVKFVSSGGTCPSGVTTGGPGSGSFTSTVFWGGVQITNTNTTVDFTSGQYVLAGTTSTSGAVLQSGISGSPTITCSDCSGSGSAGVMFISTDDTYTPVTIGGTTYSLTKPAALGGTTFYQGYVQMKDTDATLSGINMDATPTALADYNHILFWQDRRNSTDTYDSTGHVITKSIDGAPPAANHVTATSPAFELDHGNVNTQLQGVIHQPRGAWLDLSSGTGAVSNSTLQIFTGAIFCNPCGNAAATLLAVTKPVTTYKTSLIQ
jgi:Flp pilus assembly protein TadG